MGSIFPSDIAAKKLVGIMRIKISINDPFSEFRVGAFCSNKRSFPIPGFIILTKIVRLK